MSAVLSGGKSYNLHRQVSQSVSSLALNSLEDGPDPVSRGALMDKSVRTWNADEIGFQTPTVPLLFGLSIRDRYLELGVV